MSLNKTVANTLGLVALISGFALHAHPVGHPIAESMLTAKPASASTGKHGPISAAKAFLASLTPEQRETTQLPVNSPERSHWSNLPASMSDERPGLRLGDMNPDQRTASFQLLRAVLSQSGYEQTSAIVAAEAELSHDTFRSGGLGWHDENYWLAIYGQADENATWHVQFGGHHLALFISLRGNQSHGLSPMFLGTNPTAVDLAGQSFTPLSELARDAVGLMRSLRADQVSMAHTRHDDLTVGPGSDGRWAAPGGIAVSELKPASRQALLALIRRYVLLQAGAYPKQRMDKIAQRLDQTCLAWAGPIDGSAAFFYRIQGPSVIIEFQSRSNIDDAHGHIHAIYRDPSREYGNDTTPPPFPGC